MFKLRNILYFIIGFPVFIILVWLFAVPDNLIQYKIEAAISNTGQGNVRASLKGFTKGLFFTVHADSLDLDFDKTPALTITNLAGCFNPRYLIKKQLAFSFKGKMGTGDINGLLKYPADGEIKIEKTELNAIPYLTHIGIETNGYISANILLKNKSVQITFRIPDLDIQKSAVIIPFINSFRRVQGVLSVTGNAIRFDSVSLEGEKGYARLKGDIKNRFMNLSLELMPSMDKLNTIESMLIGKYIVSPGYYVIPVKGPLL
ncbi:MAG: type II secretion system protein GspN [Nitrospirae bacterium]|nr:type II secretion system protein GspN [Nitrospirota bacterium]